MIYEDRYTEPVSTARFARRMGTHLALAAGLIALSLLAGMWGYEHYEHLPWRDAFVNTAMLLGGMGPVDPLHSSAPKIFASCYALFSGLAFIGIASLLVAPFAHRILHRFHVDED